MFKRIIWAMLVMALVIPVGASAHTDGVQAKWEKNGSGAGVYDYWVYTCASSGVPDGSLQEARVIDALNEWNEIGGELRFSWQNVSYSTCINAYNGTSNVLRIGFLNLPGNTLGDTNCRVDFGQTGFGDCIMYIDNDGWTDSCGSYGWHFGTGGPSSNNVDFASVVVHEAGHALIAGGHEPSYESAIMDDNMTDVPGGCPEHVDKEERVLAHDTWNYTHLYGTSH